MNGLRWILLSVVAIAISGCGGEKPFRKETSPVTGIIRVDGATPDSEVQLTLQAVSGMDSQNPTLSRAATDASGKFSFATYAAGDGVPAGDYVLTASWQEFNIMSREYSGPDKLNKRHSDPATSQFKFTVKAGEPLDLGVVELTSK